MLQVFIDSGEGEIDYTRYVSSGSITITRTLNQVSTCSMTMTNNDANFVCPPPMSYLRIYSKKAQKNLYTGLLQNAPSLTFVGMSNRVPGTQGQMYQFAFNFSSDEYLLNIKYVPFLPAFVNQSQGAILRTIAESLCPGFFDFTYCASGDLVPYMAYDPTQNWSQIAKTFGDASRFRYSCINKEIHFQPYGDGDLGIRYDDANAKEGTFDPTALSTSSQTTPIVNDVTVVGAQEAGNNREDYFIGDGFSGAYPLKHKIFGLATAQQGSAVLLADNWDETSLNTQYWQAQDPSNNFYYGSANSSALNILTAQRQTPGTSFIAAQSGLELAGGLFMQHGEVVFNDVCAGILGGIYDTEVLNGYGNLALDENSLEAGFLIEPTASVVVTASGAAGISIQPYRQGAVPMGTPDTIGTRNSLGYGSRSFAIPPFNIVSKVNKSYVLNTQITAPNATRYTQVYRTIAGVAFGAFDPADVQGTITWSVVETDLFTGEQNFYNFTLTDQTLPATAIYALLDNYQLNITLTTTQITAPIPGSLNVKCEIGSGVLAPIYISGNIQYTGAFVTPSGGNLPILPQDLGFENNFPLGSGLGQQAAEIDSGTVTDTLNFYGDDLPGVGVRIRLQTYESQAAISRMQNAQSVQDQSAIVGDDGVRSALVTNLTPLPRTSEDCDSAAQAFLADRTAVLYNGTYKASYYFFSQFTDDIDYFPVCGRYLPVNSPQRNIFKQKYLVTSITTSIEELAGEIMTHSVTFGADMQVQKLLATFNPINTSVLTPIDTSVQPQPQTLESVGFTYLPDVSQTTISSLISGAQIVVDLNDAVPPDCFYEIRNANLNWGYNDSRLLGRYAVTGSIILPRLAYDQTWYIRLVTNRTGTIVSSRRTKVLRVVYPRVPTPPTLTYGDSSRLQYDFSGDVRNIEGILLTSGNGASGYYEAIVGSEEDMNLDLNLLRGQEVDGVTGGLGQHPIMNIPPAQRDFLAKFFNLMWEFSPGTYISIPPPLAPSINLGYRFGPSVQVRVYDNDVPARQDIDYTRLQIANSPAFLPSSILVDIATNGNPGSFTSNVPVTGELWCRAQFADYISSGGWSNALHVPFGDIIASDYMVGQGSVPPAVTDANQSGGLFTYVGYANIIVLYCAAFSILWPNGTYDALPPTTGGYTYPLDVVSGGLLPNTMYGFFPSVKNPSTPTPFIEFNGPYLNYSTNSAGLTGMYSDGSVPLTTSAFVTQTSNMASGGNTGGGGGGTGGGSNCGILSSVITLYNGEKTTLERLKIGQLVKTRSGHPAKVVTKKIVQEETYEIVTVLDHKSRAALGHTLYAGSWQPLSALKEAIEWDESVCIDTTDGTLSVVSIDDPLMLPICRIQLESVDKATASDEDHVYLLDGLWTHNVIIKGAQPA